MLIEASVSHRIIYLTSIPSQGLLSRLRRKLGKLQSQIITTPPLGYLEYVALYSCSLENGLKHGLERGLRTDERMVHFQCDGVLSCQPRLRRIRGWIVRPRLFPPLN
jgi:hypothetical protein